MLQKPTLMKSAVKYLPILPTSDKIGVFHQVATNIFHVITIKEREKQSDNTKHILYPPSFWPS